MEPPSPCLDQVQILIVAPDEAIVVQGMREPENTMPIFLKQPRIVVTADLLAKSPGAKRSEEYAQLLLRFSRG